METDNSEFFITLERIIKKFRITDEVYYVIYYNVRTADPNTLIVFYTRSTYKKPENWEI